MNIIEEKNSKSIYTDDTYRYEEICAVYIIIL